MSPGSLASTSKKKMFKLSIQWKTEKFGVYLQVLEGFTLS